MKHPNLLNKRSTRTIIRFALAIVAFFAVAAAINAPYLGKKSSSVVFGPYGPLANEAAPETLPANHLSIQALNISAPLVESADRNETAYQDALQHGVVHFPGTAYPGEIGNAYYFGHSSDLAWAKGDYKTVFALLPDIKLGEEIQITDSEGRVYRYEVTETKVVKPSDLSVLAQPTDKKLLSLQTSYPVGTAISRFIVIAELKE